MEGKSGTVRARLLKGQAKNATRKAQRKAAN